MIIVCDFFVISRNEYEKKNGIGSRTVGVYTGLDPFGFYELLAVNIFPYFSQIL